MSDPNPIIVYTSDFCAHSRLVQRFLNGVDIAIDYRNIDRDPAAREEVVTLNDGYASVPTLVFPDGRQLTEPSMRALRGALGLETTSLAERLRRWARGVMGG